MDLESHRKTCTIGRKHLIDQNHEFKGKEKNKF